MRSNGKSLHDDFQTPYLHQSKSFLRTKNIPELIHDSKSFPFYFSILESCIHIEIMSQPVILVIRINGKSLHDDFQTP